MIYQGEKQRGIIKERSREAKSSIYQGRYCPRMANQIARKQKKSRVI
jgi:hypothetical protein